MEISSLSLSPAPRRRCKTLLKVMKLTTFLLIVGCLHLSAASFGQRINLNEKDASLESILTKIEQQSGYTFFYKVNLLNRVKVNMELQNGTLQQALNLCLKDLPLMYTVVDNTVVISSKPIVFVGKVTDEQGNPMPGVTVKFKNTQQGGVTTAQGGFSVYVEDREKAVLVFSIIGYLTQEVPLKNATNPLNIVMKEDISDLDEVQVLAYGQTTKRISTANVTTISSKEIETNPVVNVLQALQGRVPGLLIQQNSGLPTTSYNVTIRGGGSFGAIPPLYVIDGVTYPAGDRLPFNIGFGAIPSGSSGNSALNFMDVSNIESVSVLKDADATSIYGARGANGVILITTKKGKAGPPRLNVNARSGVDIRGSYPTMLNTQQYLAMRHEAFRNDGVTPGATDQDVNGDWDTTAYTDWNRYASGKTAVNNKVNASYGGGNGNINYRLAGNYGNQGNIQLGGGSVQDLGVSFNLNSTSPNKKFTFDLSNAFYTNTNTEKPIDFSSTNVSTLAPDAPPLLLPGGMLNWETGDNVIKSIKLIYKSNTNNLVSTSSLNYFPIKGLALHATIGYNLINGADLRAQPSAYYIPQANVGLQTSSARTTFSIRTWTIDPNAEYTHALGYKGKLTLRAGATLVDKYNPSTSISGTGFIGDQLLYNPALGKTVTASYTQTPKRNLGYFGNANYNWANKYLLNLSLRYDGSTNFGPDHRYGTFGSVGAAWVFSEERWIKYNVPALSFGKIRASYGTTGQDNITPYSYLATYKAITAYDGAPGITPNKLSNPDLHWETTKKREVGIDLEFFNGRISASGTYYNSRTYDQLVNTILSSVTGFTLFAQNAPSLIGTTGVELQLLTNNIRTRNFTWVTSFNISMPHSKLLAYPGLDNFNTSSSANLNYEIGKPTTGVKLYDYQGVDPQTGVYFYKNAKGTVGSFLPFLSPVQLDQVADRTKFIDLAPKYFGGITNSLHYKGFQLDFMFEFKNRIGQNLQGSQPYMPGQFNINSTTAWLDRWEKPGDHAKVPKASAGINAILGQANFTQSSGAYEKATYARLSNLNFAYSFASSGALKKAHITNMMVYVQAQNLFTISKYGGGLDPENLLPGAMPPLRILTGGLNLTL
jgi:TonB-linked SusC/RagA family outer membrane protein